MLHASASPRQHCYQELSRQQLKTIKFFPGRPLMERILFVFIATLMASSWATAADNKDSVAAAPSHFNEATVAELQAKMDAGTLTSEQLTRYYLQRILELDQNGPGVNAVIELNPDAIRIAQQMDDLRRRGKVLGPLHGMPV